MSLYTEFFLNSQSDVVALELLEISHPNFTRTYRIVRNAIEGITVVLEDATTFHFDYYPLRITPIKSKADLDGGFQIDLGDLGEVLPKELDAIASSPQVPRDSETQTPGSGYAEKPRVVYRIYRSDTLERILGPINLEVDSFNFKREGSSFEARLPRLNVNRIGEYYTVDRFPMLRGFL
jgi:hypothetical protein